MQDPYVGDITIFAGDFAPDGWSICDGQLLSIATHQELFAVIGTTYGGDGQTTFALPDLRGRVPVHQGHGAGLSPRSMGQKSGQETVALTEAQLPQHNHAQQYANADPNQRGPANRALSGESKVFAPADASRLLPMNPAAISSAGQGHAHENMMPFLALNFVIAHRGIFPSES